MVKIQPKLKYFNGLLKREYQIDKKNINCNKLNEDYNRHKLGPGADRATEGPAGGTPCRPLISAREAGSLGEVHALSRMPPATGKYSGRKRLASGVRDRTNVKSRS